MPMSNSTLSRSLRIDYRRTALDTGIPDVEIRTVDRRYVIDEELGTVSVINHFGILGLDSHEFRIVNGTIRHIHSATLYRPNFNGGLDMPPVLGEAVPW